MLCKNVRGRGTRRICFLNYLLAAEVASTTDFRIKEIETDFLRASGVMEFSPPEADIDQAGQKLRQAAIPGMLTPDPSVRIREVPSWQVRPNGVMSLLSASWRYRSGRAP